MTEYEKSQSDAFQTSDSHSQDVNAKAEGCLATWRETLVVTGSFMAAYTAYLAIQSQQSSLNQEAGLGVVSLACLYGTVLLSGTITPSFLRLVGGKWSLAIAWICYSVYTASNFYPTWATLIPASILLGAIAGPMWTSQGLYASVSGEVLAKKSGKNLHAALSKVNGIFFMCYESTQITGNLISSLVLNQGSYSTSDNATRICGADDCPTSANATKIEQPERNVVYILLGVYLACDLVALGLTFFLLPSLQSSPSESDELPDEAAQDNKRHGKTMFSFFTALSDPKLIFILLFCLSASMSQGILFADYTKSYISCAIGVSMVGFAMATFGVVTAVVAAVLSKAAEYTGRYFLFGLASVCNMSMLLTLLLWRPNGDSYTIFFIIPTIWGIAVGIFHTQFNALIRLMFPEKVTTAFANYHTWNAVGFAINFAYGGVLCVRTKLYVCIILFGIGMLGYIGAETIHARQTRDTKESRMGRQ